MKINLTKENIEQYIQEGIVYRTDTASKWGMITEIRGDPDDGDWQVQDLPQVREWLTELNAELQAKQDAYLAALRQQRAGLICVHAVNQIDWKIRDEHNLYQPEPPDVIAEMHGGDWNWYVTPERFAEMQSYGIDESHFKKCKWCDNYHRPTKVETYTP